MHDFAIVGKVAEGNSQPFPRLISDIPHNKMTWTPSATRADVVRVVARYVRLEFSIRSTAGKLAIDETRVTKRVLDDRDIDIEGSSMAEFRDAINALVIRRAVYARPEAPVHRSTPLQGISSGDQPLRRVAPLRDVAPIVRPKASRAAGVPQMGARDWRATVAQKLALIPREQQASLIEAEKLRIALQQTRNLLEQGRRAAGRLKSGGRNTRNLRRHAEERVQEWRSREQFDSDRLRRLVRTKAYRDGIDCLLAACTETERIEADIFGELD